MIATVKMLETSIPDEAMLKCRELWWVIDRDFMVPMVMVAAGPGCYPRQFSVD